MVLEVGLGRELTPLVNRFVLFCFVFCWGNPNQAQIVGGDPAKYSDFGPNSAGHAHWSLKLAARSTGRRRIDNT